MADISYANLLCARHGQAVRRDDPHWPRFASNLLKILCRNVDFAEAFKALLARGATDRAAMAALLAARPACCRLGPDTMLRAYVISGVGEFLPCDACGETDYGTAYVSEGVRHAHVCFGCQLNVIRL